MPGRRSKTSVPRGTLRGEPFSKGKPKASHPLQVVLAISKVKNKSFIHTKYICNNMVVIKYDIM